MVTPLDIFSGFSVDDISAAKAFYADTLGLDVSDGPMGNLDLRLPAGGHVFIYPKPDHTPASFTILNLVVDDIDVAVDDLNARGVPTKIYDDPALPTDEKGVLRGRVAGRGPDIAWFRDPAGNVLSVLQD
ncbi:VOC family protein [Leifsonia virtsii]|uniref:VOC family protein n=1 Tax=Leifsonia virtsii TaxID=3035915 RepID=A0ABT8ISM8_9MICO|nr:VOC family protein [Leifsonia virtsii]MDN4595797.1 VOC family protein [Leifsonia virtsii]